MGRSEKIPAETAEFARRLRALKERTDRSYGSLATQLHLGASTLHRYCHGHALPVDYAPVERLARVVGATSAERVELHRLWLRAHSARTEDGENEGDGGTGEDREDETGATVVVAPAVAEQPPVGEPEPVREPEPKPESRPEPVAGAVDPGPAPGTGTGTGTEAAPAPGTAPDSGSGSDSVDEIDPPPPAATTPPMSRFRASRLRRRQVVGAALAVVAVLAGTVVVAADLGGADSRRDESAPRLSDPGPDGPVDPLTPSARSSAPSAGASPSKSGGGPKASPSGSSDVGEAGGRNEGDGGTSAEGRKPDAGKGGTKPLVWSADSHKWQLDCGHTYLIDRAPSAVPPPPNSQDARQWATALGAVHGNSSITQATVRAAAGAGPVVIQEVFVRVVGRRAPLDWNAYDMSSGCGGSITPAVFAVDLDKSRPVVRPVDGGSEQGPLPAPKLPYQVTASEPLVLRIEASTSGCDCDWFVELRWSAGDRTGIARIDEGGKPFRTSASASDGLYGHDYESGKWVMGP
ncbi:helix-turn-helix domain-containing protein [Streptomyces sp. NBC_01725]|uniref:helix-turn-helix domain-containing protein n=1 Tax=Streptomyces sp. NBC_01725 TaxID=2975923 RepID=UPI002E2C8D8B|nr:helix-turn-helix transcriptional regulator [Streptomyces sp. NBC_01725]